jgi:glutamate synthase (ferredoxin)
VAYIYDPGNKIHDHNFNMEMIELEQASQDDLKELKELIENHHKHTESDVAEEVLKNWKTAPTDFIKVMPVEYKKALKLLEDEKMRKAETELKTA